MQINVGHVDENGIYNGTFSTVASGGYIRSKAESDAWMNKLAVKKGLVRPIFD